jgi:hypothetical protein
MLPLTASAAFDFDHAFRRGSLAGARVALRLGLRFADRLTLRDNRLGLRVADRLGQHLEQLSLALLIAHRSLPVTGETTVARQRRAARKPAD